MKDKAHAVGLLHQFPRGSIFGGSNHPDTASPQGVAIQPRSRLQVYPLTSPRLHPVGSLGSDK